jgi:drug/metabolite transporter (DMT)-like permease
LSPEIIALVLVAALMHAGWNTIAKLNAARAGDAVVVGIMAGWPALVVLPFTVLPERASWPQLVASVIIHFFYFRARARAYHGGDLSVAYPLMRGVPPLIVAALAALVFGEQLSLTGWTAILLLVAGVLTLGWDGLRARALRGSSARFVAIQIAIIACYTLVDGWGVRAAGSALSYIAWMFVLTAAALGFAAVPSIRELRREGARAFAVAAAGGIFTFGSYGVALWAMTHALVALVAALRETSILFGAGLGAWLLRERFGACRWMAVGMILAGVAGMRLV